MKSRVLTVVSILTLWSAGVAFAADEYNDVPAGDSQSRPGMKFSMNKYDGGEISSPIHGQTKAQAWCTCMWNETLIISWRPGEILRDRQGRKDECGL